jgi:CheY-like chemotaxis protein
VARTLKADPFLAGIPLILLSVKSAWASDGMERLGPGMVRWCQDLAADVAYCFKPFSPEELVALVYDRLPDAPS